MNAIAHGIDVVDIATFARLAEDTEGDFIQRCFTLAEQTATKDSANRINRLAGRFAAKEAVAKALGTGFNEEVAPLDIQVDSLSSGEPTVTLTGGAAVVARRRGMVVWRLSVSHSAAIAIASVIVLGK